MALVTVVGWLVGWIVELGRHRDVMFNWNGKQSLSTSGRGGGRGGSTADVAIVLAGGPRAEVKCGRVGAIDTAADHMPLPSYVSVVMSVGRLFYGCSTVVLRLFYGCSTV